MNPTDERQDDFDRGVKNRRAVLGDAWVDKSLNNATEFNAEFQHLITRYAWHDIWGRPGLDHPTRRLLVLGMTMGLARWEEFELHCRAAIRGGVPLGLIKETLMQGAIYCGVPAANTAFKITMDILRAEGLLPPPAPLSANARVAVHHTFSQPQLALAVQGAADAQGAPIVLSHALGLDLHMWDDLAAHLAAQGHPVLRYDHRGHGGSAVPPGPYTMDQLVDDAARLIREWGRGPVVWVGLSMGGMVGQGLAVRHPELIRALVLANTTSQYPPAAAAVFAQRVEKVEQGGMAAIVDSVMERYFSADFRASRPDAVDAARAKVLRSDPAGYVATCHAVGRVDWLERLSEVRCPTLVIAGALDVGAPVAMSQAMAERIPGAELVVFDQASHLSVAEQPAAFTATLDGFLKRLAV
ncbi:alpha/beta fold hydrolase [Rhizobacter sp. Root404]|uniref:bifunctional 4-carboxymuconolactone decarboxylase/3-oxoadipate enol-lactonase PcaCD n=1 Tax=Rhizobacter sp. Root404 TaxID=1736528 RepID=UPI0006FA124B|nr:alpha/beta fold hydrolase [Rhizobacter sp. Root404]KQW40615.1 hydrolase [Rhizobacter sp. Root404]